jgi:hemoglobin-like flavoprotein
MTRESRPELSEGVVARFQESLQRCLDQGDFIGAFYERFLASSEKVRQKFAHTEFSKQRKVLERSLFMMARAALRLEDGLAHLRHIAETHNRRRLDIGPHLYTSWMESLLLEVRNWDPCYSPEVEQAWRDALGAGVDEMVRVYRESQTNRPPK